MNDREIKELLRQGTSQQFQLDPNMKNEINRALMESLMREVRTSLASKKIITVVLVKS